MADGYATFSVHCDTLITVLTNAIMQVWWLLELCWPVLANVCKRSTAIANLRRTQSYTATIYLILSATQWNSLKYNLRASKIQKFSGLLPLTIVIYSNSFISKTLQATPNFYTTCWSLFYPHTRAPVLLIVMSLRISLITPRHDHLSTWQA